MANDDGHCFSKYSREIAEDVRKYLCDSLESVRKKAYLIIQESHLQVTLQVRNLSIPNNNTQTYLETTVFIQGHINTAKCSEDFPSAQ